MHCTIKNLTSRPVLLRLNSGQTRYLDGDAELSEILAVDVKDNARLRRLTERRVIAIEAGGIARPGTEPAKPGAPRRISAAHAGKGAGKTGRKRI